MTGQLGKLEVYKTLKQLVYRLTGRLLIVNHWISVLLSVFFNPELQIVFNILEDRLLMENRPKLAAVMVQD